MIKEEVLQDIKSLEEDIDNCISELLSARWKVHDKDLEGKALSRMESLMVGAQQELSFLYDYIKDKKTVDDAWTDADVANWYQDSVDETAEPIWTDKHIEELTRDFYLIYKEDEEDTNR